VVMLAIMQVFLVIQGHSGQQSDIRFDKAQSFFCHKDKESFCHKGTRTLRFTKDFYTSLFILCVFVF